MESALHRKLKSLELVQLKIQLNRLHIIFVYQVVYLVYGFFGSGVD